MYTGSGCHHYLIWGVNRTQSTAISELLYSYGEQPYGIGSVWHIAHNRSFIIYVSVFINTMHW
jgi:hypothetical protein